MKRENKEKEKVLKEFSQYLNEQLKESGKKNIDLANYMGVSGPTVSEWRSGKKMPSAYRMRRLNDFFIAQKNNDKTKWTLTTETFNYGEKPKEEWVKIPLLGVVAAGIPMDAVENIEDWEQIPASMGNDKEYFALRIKGQSMEPVIGDGDRVIVKKQPDVDSGQVAVVLVNGNEATVKKIKKLENGIWLIGFNPSVYAPTFYSAEEIQSLPVQIIGRVVESRKSF